MFRSEFFFRTTRELEYLFFLSRKAQNFFPEFNIRLYDKNSESDYYFFLLQNQNIFFSNIGNQNIFLQKNHNPPLQVKGILSTSCVIFLYPKLLSISVLTFIKWKLTPSYVAKDTKKTQNYRYQNYCPDDNIQICSYGLLCEHVLSMRTV